MSKTLGRYRLLEEIGRGAMGAVHRAVDPLIGREVAIKTLHANLPDDGGETRERFIREARSAGRLSHPGIVTIYDVGEQDGSAYIAMELLAGRSLQQMLRSPEPIALDAAVDLAAQLAEALEHAHQSAIVHRDVKPANVVVAPSGRCKLTDFGVAYVASSSMTQTGAALGTPRYMSPEQAIGQKADARSDIFSLGVILYEMLTRRSPFERPEDSSVFQLLYRIAREPHPALRVVDPRLPAALERIVDRALAKKPAERYPSAGEMAAELRRFARPSVHPGTYDKTLAVPAAQQAETRSQLIDDLEEFSKRWEQQEQARLRAEEEERLRKEQQVRSWGEAEERKREAFQRERGGEGAPAGESDPRWQALEGRAGALEILRKQSALQPGRPDEGATKEKQQVALDQAMRAAFQYFAELTKEVNAVEPASGRPYEFLYLGRLPAVTLSDAWVDSRPAHIPGRDVCELIEFRYRITPSEAASATLLGDDVERCERYLASLKVAFQARHLAVNDFGKPTRAVVTVSGTLPCEIKIRGDYEALTATLELLNVRRFGRTRCVLPTAQFRASIDDLARYLLGADDEFLRHVSR